MDINKQTNRQHKTTDVSPYLRKAQVISPGIDLLKQKREGKTFAVIRYLTVMVDEQESLHERIYVLAITCLHPFLRMS